MPAGDACLLDSNILLRISKSDDPQHAVIAGHDRFESTLVALQGFDLPLTQAVADEYLVPMKAVSVPTKYPDGWVMATS